MDRHVGEWRHAVDRFWQAEGPDWTEVAHVVSSIAASEETDLRHAATQAQPSIRNAANNPQDHMTRVVARRRLGVIRDVLHELTTPKFGRRGAERRALTEDERYREMLGLPFDRQLAATEIHQAFRRSAKRVHPDAGGDAHAFLALAAARDALMHAPAKKGG
ncbi:MAG: hypothetical protein GY844_12760 [Bradyrhizobium sp.]|nr:hypothetical protein [Bradyrhizobium sp.]